MAQPAPVAPVAATPAAPPPPMVTQDGKVVFDPQPAPAPVGKDTGISDDTLAVAGTAGVALLLAAGSGFLFMRRRRRDEEYPAEAEVTLTEPMPVPEMAATGMAPAMVHAAPPIPSPEPALAGEAQTSRLPSGFDISRFGRHTQAAYRGPTPDNRSLSLKKRLKVASFYDQRERMAAEAKLAPHAGTTPVAPTAPVSQPAVAPRQTDHVTTRVKQAPRPGFRPIFSS